MPRCTRPAEIDANLLGGLPRGTLDPALPVLSVLPSRLWLKTFRLGIVRQPGEVELMANLAVGRGVGQKSSTVPSIRAVTDGGGTTGTGNGGSRGAQTDCQNCTNSNENPQCVACSGCTARPGTADIAPADHPSASNTRSRGSANRDGDGMPRLALAPRGAALSAPSPGNLSRFPQDSADKSGGAARY
jgi:hypothetical protein